MYIFGSFSCAPHLLTWPVELLHTVGNKPSCSFSFLFICRAKMTDEDDEGLHGVSGGLLTDHLGSDGEDN